MPLTISGVGIGGKNPCRFVAEVSNAHNGNFSRCLRLIDAAKAAGADFVKFQCYTPDELIELRGDKAAPEPWGSQGWTMRTLYEKARTPLEWFPALVQHCKDVGIQWFSSVFGKESLALLESLECPAYKIARLDARHDDLTLSAAKTGKPLIVSHDHDDTFPAPDALFLYCPAGYPTPRENVSLPYSFRSFYTGLSSHCLDPRLPIAAVARGCKLIEMHFMLAEEPSELEANVSLDQYAFAKMVDDVRATEAMLA